MHFFKLLNDLPSDLFFQLTDTHLTHRDVALLIGTLKVADKKEPLGGYNFLLTLLTQRFTPYVASLPNPGNTLNKFLNKAQCDGNYYPLKLMPKNTVESFIQNNLIQISEWPLVLINAGNTKTYLLILETIIRSDNTDLTDDIIYKEYISGRLPINESTIIAQYCIRLIIDHTELDWDHFISNTLYSLKQKFFVLKMAIARLNPRNGLMDVLRALLTFQPADRIQFFKESLHNLAFESSLYIVEAYLDQQSITLREKIACVRAALDNRIPNPALIVYMKNSASAELKAYFNELRNNYIKFENIELYELDEDEDEDVELAFRSPLYNSQNPEAQDLLHVLLAWQYSRNDCDSRFFEHFGGLYEDKKNCFYKDCERELDALFATDFSQENNSLRDIISGFRFFLNDNKVPYPIRIEAFLILDNLSQKFGFKIDYVADVAYLCSRILITANCSWQWTRLGQLFTGVLYDYRIPYLDLIEDRLERILDHDHRSDETFNDGVYCTGLSEMVDSINILYRLGYKNRTKLLGCLLEAIQILSYEDLSESNKTQVRSSLHALLKINDSILQINEMGTRLSIPLQEQSTDDRALLYFMMLIRNSRFYANTLSETLSVFNDFMVSYNPGFTSPLILELIKHILPKIDKKNVLAMGCDLINKHDWDVESESELEIDDLDCFFRQYLVKRIDDLYAPELMQLAQLMNLEYDLSLYNDESLFITHILIKALDFKEEKIALIACERLIANNTVDNLTPAQQNILNAFLAEGQRAQRNNGYNGL